MLLHLLVILNDLNPEVSADKAATGFVWEEKASGDSKTLFRKEIGRAKERIERKIFNRIVNS